jgi:hypothetical protein
MIELRVRTYYYVHVYMHVIYMLIIIGCLVGWYDSISTCYYGLMIH